MSLPKWIFDLKKEMGKASQGIWEVSGHGEQVFSEDGMVCNCDVQIHGDDDEVGLEQDQIRSENNANYIAAIHNNFAKLIEHIELQNKTIQMLREQMKF